MNPRISRTPLLLGTMLVVAVVSSAHAQSITIEDYQKISSTEGGLSAVLADESRFGKDMAYLGDLDGDGIGDLAVGNPLDDDGGLDRGAVWILLLNVDGTVASHQKISDTEGGFTGLLDDFDQFGNTVAALGDLDGDGVDDIVTSALGDDDVADAGAVWILFLNNDGTVKAHQKITEGVGGFTGDLTANDRFGGSIANLGDLDGDSIVDIAVGAYFDDDGFNNNGAVWILFLNADGTVKTHQKISETEGGFTGNLSEDSWGGAVANIGDLDDDGVVDLAVGEGGCDDGGTGRGAVWILFLNSNGTVRVHQKISDTQGGFTGSLDDGDALGVDLAGLGDLDGDGTEDVAAGAFKDDDGGTDRGAVWLLFLNADGTVKGHQKLSSAEGGFTGVLEDEDYFGNGLALLKGVGGKGLAVGAIWDDDGGTNRGAVWLLFFRDPSDVLVPGGFTEITSPALGTNGIGVSWADYDNDGDLDVYYAGSRLVRNDGAGAFVALTSGPLDYLGIYSGVFGDYDADGDLDLFLSNGPPSESLLRNDGSDVFTNVTVPPLDDAYLDRAVTWVDFNLDGHLDLFVTSHSSCNRLFQNDGTGGFTDHQWSCNASEGAAWGDFDNDADQDIYVTFRIPNVDALKRNDEDGVFTHVTSGDLLAADDSYGVAWGDYDNDADLDLYVTNPGNPNKLFRNEGGGTFVDVTSPPLDSAAGDYGVAWGDYDNDGDLDLFTTAWGDNRLYNNDGAGNFLDVTEFPLDAPFWQGGAAWGDYDGDGDLDLAVAQENGGANKLYRNDLSSYNHWLHVKLTGVISNLNGVGAQIRIVTDNGNQIREVTAGSGYMSQNSLTAEFGLAELTMVTMVEVRWPTGGYDRIYDVAADQVITITETPDFRDATASPLDDTYDGRGVNWADYDNDGDLDVWFANEDYGSSLCRNEGGGTFSYTGVAAFTGGFSNNFGGAWADYDNDGDLDMYMTLNGRVRLIRNDGLGGFRWVTNDPVYPDIESRGVAWGDYDNDGDVDAYVTVIGANILWRNDGNDTLTDVTGGLPLADPGNGQGVSWGDYDNDGDLDLYFANDGQANKLLRNDGGTFVDVTGGLPLGDTGNGRGVAWGDYDNDGDLDLLLTNEGQQDKLLENDGGDSFSDATPVTMIGERASFGVSWLDYDRDGQLDFYVTYADGRNNLFVNQGNGNFRRDRFLPLGDKGVGRGHAWGDYDNDGDLDVYVMNDAGANVLLRNDSESPFHWLNVDLVGVVSNASGIGSRIRVVTSGASQIREITSGSGYLSQNSLTAEFGLGFATVADTVEVRWPTLYIDRIYGVAADQTLTITETPDWMDVTQGDLAGGGNSRGVASVDYDDDGDQDIYVADSGASSQMLRNDGGGVFLNVASGNLASGGVVASTWADYDNDGDLDGYLSRVADNRLLRNDGGGVFALAAQSPLGDPDGSKMAAWADYDLDGDVDLYVVKYGQANRLFRNDGNDTFTDVSGTPLDDPGLGQAAAWGDYDGDGDPDLYLSNHASSNRLFRNDAGTFVEVAASPLGDGGPGRGVAWGDYDNDGDLDLFLAEDGAADRLFRNDGGDAFVDVASGPLTEFRRSHSVTWEDFDNDGDLDLFVTHFDDENQYLRNDGADEFIDITSVPFNMAEWWQSAACADYDEDGDLDVYLVSMSGPNMLVRNDMEGDNHWVHIDPIGSETNRSAIGARVRTVVGEVSQMREIDAGSGYLSQNSLTAEFGLGAATDIDAIEVHWPTRVIDRLTDVPSDTVYVITETPTYAVIDSVADVPDDQGGWVRIHFHRSGFDRVDETATPIATYAIHRRVDSEELAATVLARSERNETEPGFPLYRLGDRVFLAREGAAKDAPPGLWEVLGTVPARQQDDYIYLAPTVADSAQTIPWSVYFIAAHTPTPSVFYDSPPDSGYSTDDIAPGAPEGFTVTYRWGQGNHLSWDPAPEPDFQYHNIYRDPDPSFTPGPENHVEATATTSWIDPTYEASGGMYYQITTVDHAGNESDSAAPETVSGFDDGPPPERFALHPNAPNPFNPSTVIQFDVPTASRRVTLRVYDVSGRLIATLIDGIQEPGSKTVIWRGTDEQGQEVGSGIYFVQLRGPGFEQARKMTLLR